MPIISTVLGYLTGTQSPAKADDVTPATEVKPQDESMQAAVEKKTKHHASQGNPSGDQLVPSSDEKIPHVEEACITESMEQAEKEIHQQLHKDDDTECKESVKEWHDMVEQQRFARLQHLLDKSNIYCQFLLKRMEDQRKEEENRQKRQEKKEENKLAKPEQQVPEVKEKRATRSGLKEASDSQDSVSPGVPKTPARRGRKRKAEGDPKASYKIADYISEEAIVKKQKLGQKENKTPPTSPSIQQVPKGKSPKVSQKETIVESVKHSTHAPKEIAAQTRYINGEEVSPLQPVLLTGGALRSYQLEGVEWLKGLYENGVNGILADEMGLGKTIQCIGLVSYLIEMGVRGPFLVAAPLSTLPNWVSEFRRFSPQIPVILYHGSIQERTSLRRKITKLKKAGPFETMPVVVTSYEIAMNDQKHLFQLMWKHMIVDEGHRIKNLNCRLIRELKSYNSANRLLLTGTPLQNNLAELWSLLNFLLPDIFDDLNSFQRWFDFSAINDEGGNEKIIAQEKEHQVLERLHSILTPFLLRRLKTDVELSLPPKKEVLVRAPLTSKQTEFYRAALDKTILDIVGDNKDKKEDKVEISSTGRKKRKGRRNINYKIFDDENGSIEELAEELATLEKSRREICTPSQKSSTYDISIKITNILMLLRKCCNHPYLLEYPLDPVTQQYKIDEELVRCSGKMLLLDQMVPALKRRGHKILIFSQMTKMLDILQDYCYLRGYQYSRLDGSMKVEDRREEIDAFASDPEKFIFLLSTRAGGLGLNLSAADTVIIYDSDWNPQSDLQAQDRCHRIGQTKPILVYRLVTSNTVDQKIVERAASKRKLEKMVIYKGKFKGKVDGTTLNALQLKELLESSHHDEIISKDEVILSQSELESLLDRSSMYVKRETSASVPDIDDTDSALFRVIEEKS
ncbi:predicted protein [Nematostella vectensis]|uniref:Proliferation-associated SNF2-like protein n=1 Tax=Nematostella vectensis TaxID=45351 RepID=A7RPD7_NEMVE|nr:predicted protein [Nematostella vectensis]|eukprot:XP_001638732.1 predicted protein [Nematostella vectensis]